MKMSFASLALAFAFVSSAAQAATIHESFSVMASNQLGKSYKNKTQSLLLCEFVATGTWSHGDWQITDADGNVVKGVVGKYGHCGAYGRCYRDDLLPGTLVVRLEAGDWDFASQVNKYYLEPGQEIDFAMNDAFNTYSDNAMDLRVDVSCTPQ